MAWVRIPPLPAFLFTKLPCFFPTFLCRPLSLTDDYSSGIPQSFFKYTFFTIVEYLASRQMTRPLPPVPTKTSVNRPLPPTPPDRVSTPTRYKRLSESPSVTPPTSHRLIHQSKSSSKSIATTLTHYVSSY